MLWKARSRPSAATERDQRHVEQVEGACVAGFGHLAGEAHRHPVAREHPLDLQREPGVAGVGLGRQGQRPVDRGHHRIAFGPGDHSRQPLVHGAIPAAHGRGPGAREGQGERGARATHRGPASRRTRPGARKHPGRRRFERPPPGPRGRTRSWMTQPLLQERGDREGTLQGRVVAAFVDQHETRVRNARGDLLGERRWGQRVLAPAEPPGPGTGSRRARRGCRAGS